MSNSTSMKLPVWFWIVGAIAVVWNLFGVLSYLGFVTMSDEALAALPEAQQALLTSYPAWVKGVFAVAVFAGVAGSLLLLLRKTMTVPVFGVSLAAVLLQMTWWLGFSGAVAVYGTGVIFMPALVIIAAGFFLWFSMNSKSKGWLG